MAVSAHRGETAVARAAEAGAALERIEPADRVIDAMNAQVVSVVRGQRQISREEANRPERTRQLAGRAVGRAARSTQASGELSEMGHRLYGLVRRMHGSALAQ